MSRHALPLNRFFVASQYSVFYRSARKFQWDESSGDYRLLFLLGGQLTAGQSTVMAPSEGLLIDPSSTVKIHGRNCETLLVAISPSLLVDYAVRMRLVGPAANIAFATDLVKDDRRLIELLSSLRAELTAEHAGKDIVLGAVIEQLLVHLLRNFANMRRSEELELSRVGLIDRRIRRAVELMHAQLDRDLTLKEIAEASFLSPFHFARLFKKLTGTSPHAYLATLRTKRAQLLLAETDYSITEISSRVGYASASHFTKAFRQSTGLTPRAFRQALVSR
jgi:AraC family transcriptional regulator